MPPIRKMDFCPFCGSRPVLKVKTIMGDQQFKVACIKERCFVTPETKFFPSESLAVFNWNDRYCEDNQVRKNVLWQNRLEIKTILHDHERLCRSGQKKIQLNRVLWLLKILKGALDGRGRIPASKGEHITEG